MATTGDLDPPSPQAIDYGHVSTIEVSDVGTERGIGIKEYRHGLRSSWTAQLRMSPGHKQDDDSLFLSWRLHDKCNLKTQGSSGLPSSEAVTIVPAGKTTNGGRRNFGSERSWRLIHLQREGTGPRRPKNAGKDHTVAAYFHTDHRDCKCNSPAALGAFRGISLIAAGAEESAREVSPKSTSQTHRDIPLVWPVPSDTLSEQSS
ncbi:hypothetical protein BJ322DRAFT_1024258 [Thelephora terrestris]|uniref:Uncharacterized protein n=1 Tax=Thelephora terrestris TaxID=56493 RepID=A0A9P6H5E5_9AGAM|nr:hypothetical protein BJ322DRAFT_1024258 [Thelephora terrestris]